MYVCVNTQAFQDALEAGEPLHSLGNRLKYEYIYIYIYIYIICMYSYTYIHTYTQEVYFPDVFAAGEPRQSLHRLKYEFIYTCDTHTAFHRDTFSGALAAGEPRQWDHTLYQR